MRDGLIGSTRPLEDAARIEDAYRRAMAQTSFTVTLIGIALVLGTADHGIHLILGAIFLAGGLFTKK